jgi:hypothetical protein
MAVDTVAGMDIRAGWVKAKLLPSRFVDKRILMQAMGCASLGKKQIGITRRLSLRKR